jgi:hypothetical protein
MGPLDIANHLANFLAPAAVLALVLALAGRIFRQKSASPSAIWSLFAINFVVISLVSVAGLVLFGRDGKMLTYLAQVLAGASSQWWQSGGASR